MKKLRVSMMLALALILLLGACSSGGNKSGTGTETPPPQTGGSTETGSGGGGNAKDEKPHLELNWFVHASNNANLPSKDKDFVKKIIEEKFNVTLNIEHMEIGDDFHTKLNLKLVGRGKDVPDMYMAGGAQSNTYVIDGLTLDLTNYVTPEKMPNYFKYWVTEGELERYQIQNVFARAPVPFPKQYYTAYYIRKDWIDNLNAKGINVKIPETIEEMEEVAKAFTFNDPNNSGKQDTYGFTMAGNGRLVGVQWPQYLQQGMYGLMLDGDYFVDGYSDVKMEQVLDGIRSWMDQGIVDPDWFLQKGGEDINKAAQGRVGMIHAGARYFAFDNDPRGIQYQTKEILKAAGKTEEAEKVDWQPFHPFKDTGVAVEALPGNPFLFGPDTDPAKVERTIEILDWMAGEEGYLLVRYGQEGVHYTRDGNTITLNPEAYKKDVTDNGDFLLIYQFFASADEPHVFGIDVIRPDETDRDRAILEEVMSYKYYKSIGTNVAPPEGYNLADFRNQLYAVHAKILFEEKDASNWLEYREELMEKYGGRAVFEAYAEQISAAHGRTIKFRDN